MKGFVKGFEKIATAQAGPHYEHNLAHNRIDNAVHVYTWLLQEMEPEFITNLSNWNVYLRK